MEIDAIKTAIQNTINKNKSNSENSSDKEYEGKIVSGEAELLPYIEKGWNIVKELSNGKIVIRRDRVTASG